MTQKIKTYIPCSPFGIGDAIHVRGRGIGVIIEAKCTFYIPSTAPQYGGTEKELKWYTKMPETVNNPGHILRIRYGVEFVDGGASYWHEPKLSTLVKRGYLWEVRFGTECEATP